jgi:two-component sensor histidine kinase
MPESSPPGPDPENPVVEPTPAGDTEEVSRRALRQRIRQQEILAELGVLALQRGTTFAELLGATVRFAAVGLGADLCKILEYMPKENRFLLRAGVGWNTGLIGVATVGADLDSPSGFALKTGKPVISNHLENEERFRTPELLRVHGVRRAINVILQGDDAPYGVLEVDSRSEGEFSEQDISFLQGAANILGMAIERQRYERNLQAALDYHKVLLNEINHRVKNSLQLVASLFSLQAGSTSDTGVAQSLREAMVRVTAIARIHERLYKTADIGTVDLTAYLTDICSDLRELTATCDLSFETGGPMPIATDRAVRVALLATELITNAAKHAYPAETGGPIVVRLVRTGDIVTLSVSDRGSGLQEAPPANPGVSGLGMRIMHALTTQTGGTLEIRRGNPGTEFAISLPLEASPSLSH